MLATAAALWIMGELGSVVVDAFAGRTLKDRLEERERLHAFENSIATALKRFSEKYPSLSASFFDEGFVRGAASGELKKFLRPNETPSPADLSTAWQVQFARPTQDVFEAAADFIEFVWDALQSEPALDVLADQRRTAELLKIVSDPERTFGDLQRTIKTSANAQLTKESTERLSDILEAFGPASAALLNWPQLIDGKWIERPELNQLIEFCTQSDLQGDSNVVVLLGGPGSGKSAILARLGENLKAGGFALLAIKSDMLPKSIGSLGDLDKFLTSPAPIVDCLRSLAHKHTTVLLIDQLDALSDLMDQHTDRLNIMLSLVAKAQSIKNLRIVLSCRAFEFIHDARLSTIKASQVSLINPPWESVIPFLQEHGLNAASWPDPIKDVLLTPQHLNLFLKHLAAAPGVEGYRSYQEMVEAVLGIRLKSRSGGVGLISAAMDIAKAMADEEELWLPAARFEGKYHAEIRHLQEADILRTDESGTRFGFRHQSIFDFLRARAFVRDGGSLTQLALSRQNGLHLRPTVWAALNYLRLADPNVYRNEIAALSGCTSLRLHLRLLLVEFLSSLHDPDRTEITILLPMMDDPILRKRSLWSMRQNPGWFNALIPKINLWMTADEPTAWHVHWLLCAALKKYQSRVIDLVIQHWLNSDKAPIAFRVIEENEVWDEQAISVVLKIMDLTEIAPIFIRQLVGKISKSAPEAAFKVMVYRLRKQLEAAKSERKPMEGYSGDPDNISQRIEWSWSSRADHYGPIAKILDHSTDWHDLSKTTERHPKIFVEAIWPWFCEVLALLSDRPSPDEYRQTDGIIDYVESDSADTHYDRSPIGYAVSKAIQAWAASSSEEFIAFVRGNVNSDLMSVHSIITQGLTLCASECPDFVLRYLTEDRRRMAIGTHGDRHKHTKRTIAAVYPYLDLAQREALDAAILSYNHSANKPDDDARIRFERIKWNREHRLRLLWSIPESLRSPKLRRHIQQEERALGPIADFEYQGGMGGFIGSPISLARLKNASDPDIIQAFSELTDDVRHHPKDWMKGGGLELAREFALLAKENPDRALGIMRKLHPGRNELPIALAIREFTTDHFDAATLIAIIKEFDGLGFTSGEFRSSAADCLVNVAKALKGLPAETCSFLEGWLTEFEDEDSIDDDGLKDDKAQPILWNSMGARILPGGNFPILYALEMGYLLRAPLDANGWLAFLLRHIERSESIKVWQALSDNLRFLQNADKELAYTFFRKLVSKYPQLLMSRDGVRLVAWNHLWLPTEFSDLAISNWLQSSWARGRQAAGEFVLYRAMLVPADAHAQEISQQIIGDPHSIYSTPETRLGAAYTAAELWSVSQYRRMIGPYLSKLMEYSDEGIGNAAMDIFRKVKSLEADEQTEMLLRDIALKSHLLRRHSHFLIDRLQEGLRDGVSPKLVFNVIDGLIRENIDELGDLRTSWAGDSKDIIDILFTLQRFTETREEATTCFEALMVAGAYGIDESLREIDRRI